MKEKALIIGAPPLPFEGPSVSLEGQRWRVMPDENYRERVEVVVKRNGSETRHPLTADELIIEGESAHAEILEDISELDLLHISVNLQRVL